MVIATEADFVLMANGLQHATFSFQSQCSDYYRTSLISQHYYNLNNIPKVAIANMRDRILIGLQLPAVIF
jgi:hypothetical protein